jgi:hypothetical protein
MNSLFWTRRAFLVRSAMGAGGILLAGIAPEVLFAAQKQAATAAANSEAFRFFSPDEAADMQAFAAQIIPSDETPGANEACRELGLKHRFTRPYTPRTNGKAERFIQTALREWAYARQYQNSNERSQELRPWLHQYNWHRPHASLDHAPPISRAGIDQNNLLSLHS